MTVFVFVIKIIDLRLNSVIFSDDGNTKITEDKYGSPLKEVPVKDMIDMIETEIKNDKDYRRYQPCLNLLKGFDLNRWENFYAAYGWIVMQHKIWDSMGVPYSRLSGHEDSFEYKKAMSDFEIETALLKNLA